jgi:hypothetical protein
LNLDLINGTYTYLVKRIAHTQDASATPSGIKREWYVCMYFFNSSPVIFTEMTMKSLSIFRTFSFEKTQLKIMYIANNTLDISKTGGFPISPYLEMFLFYTE